MLALVGAGALASATTVAADAGTQRSAWFHVTLTAHVTKTWDYRVSDSSAGCAISTRVQGSRVLTLRSARPTAVTVTSVGDRLRFGSSVVRHLVATVVPRGAVIRTQSAAGGCAGRTTRSACTTRALRSRATETARFYLSGKDEISFRRTKDFLARAGSCPAEAADVRAERPGLELAQGEISPADFFDPGIRYQTAVASFEETTDLDGDPPGRVIERVSWSLKFERVR